MTPLRFGWPTMCLLSLAATSAGGFGPRLPWEQALDPARIASNETTFLRGRRAAIEVFVGSERAGRSAFSPLDAFNHLELRFEPQPTLRRVRVTPYSVERTWEFEGGASVTSRWRVDADRPILAAALEFRGARRGRLACRVTAEIVSNVGWIGKFAQRDDDVAAAVGPAIEFRDGAVRALALRVWMSPPAGEAVAAPPAAAPGRRTGRLSVLVAVGAGSRRRVEVRVAATDSAAEMAALGRGGVVRDGSGALRGAFRFSSPEPGLDEFVRACQATILQNVRTLPFGVPWSLEGAKNARVAVMTASPDYHGVFANDCIQTLWEAGLLGPAIDEAARNSVDAMFRLGPHESVEWFTGDGNLWRFTYPLGDTPQIVMGACWRLLWTGDRRLAERWWPDIRRCLAVLRANDADGDWLEDRPNTPYPEQPDPGAYNHEMLYVQCFWHQAYLKAAQVAEWLGKPEAAALGEGAARIAASIEGRFGTPYGLGVWLDSQHRAHPHVGHEAIIAAAQGDVSDERSRRIVRTAMATPVWTEDGPLRASPGHGVASGSVVWTFMRWKLVLALFRLGETDSAVALARRWAAQERSSRYAAPEGFPTITGTTGKAYTWTAGRAMRAIALGLSGMDLDGEGVRFAPGLPTGWGHYELAEIPVHGARITLRVRRGPARVRVDGAERSEARIPYAALGEGRRLVEVWRP